MSNNIVKIEFPATAKLRPSNYKLWRFNVERHLKNHNVWELVTKDKKPIEADHETAAAFASAYEMWTVLQRVHKKKDRTSKLAASQAFHDYRYETGMEMSKHIANIKNLARRCKDLDDILDELSDISVRKSEWTRHVLLQLLYIPGSGVSA
ncbi:integrase core domain protein [Lasius niger]|uniref:Integrase core domain protein n=1 Tax=Lasius niger TaxID=67767 RepID=A0A0J7MTX5_LASNI|nr:integrase core domain protein [Lasius niger]